MAHLKYYKVGQTWVLSCHLGQRLGLIHLGSWRWYEPLRLFPSALYKHLRLALKVR